MLLINVFICNVISFIKPDNPGDDKGANIAISLFNLFIDLHCITVII